MINHVQRVLQIDDDEFDLRAFARNFRRASGEHELKQVTTMAQARDLLRVWTPDLILLDLGLPDEPDPVKAIESIMPHACALVLTGADPDEVMHQTKGYLVHEKSRSKNPLMRGGRMIPLAAQVASGQILAVKG